MKRLRLEAIPLFYQHRFDKNTPVEDVAGTLVDLIKEGKVLHWGMCEVNAETIRKAHAICPLTAIQSEYHLMLVRSRPTAYFKPAASSASVLCRTVP